MTTYKCQHCGLVTAMSANDWMYHRLTVPGHTDKYGRILAVGDFRQDLRQAARDRRGIRSEGGIV